MLGASSIAAWPSTGGVVELDRAVDARNSRALVLPPVDGQAAIDEALNMFGF